MFKRSFQWFYWLMLVILLVPFAQSLTAGVSQVRAAANSGETKLFDTPDASATANYTIDGDQVDWLVKVTKKADTPSRVGLNLSDAKGVALPLNTGDEAGLNSRADEGGYYNEPQANSNSSTFAFTTSHVDEADVKAALWTAKDGKETDVLKDAAPVKVAIGPMPDVTSSRAKDLQPTTDGARDITQLKEASELPTATDENGKSTPTIFTSVDVYDITQNKKSPSSINPGDDILLTYNWGTLPEDLRKEIQTGDYFDFTLPKPLEGLKFPNADIYDSDDSSVKIGTVSFDSNSSKARFTFNKMEKSNVKGTISVSGTVARKAQDINNAADIPFSAKADNQFPPISLKGGTILTKTAYNKNQNGQAVTYEKDGVHVDWIVTLNSVANTLHAGETLTEELPTNTASYKINSIAAQQADDSGVFTDATKDDDLLKLKTGDPSDGSTDPVFEVKGDTNDKFTLDITTVTPYKNLKDLTVGKDDNARKLSASNITNIVNNASFEDNNKIKTPATANVNVGKQADLTKSAGEYDAKTGLIQWTLTYHKPKDVEAIDAGDTFTDTIGGGLQMLDKDGNPITDGPVDVAAKLPNVASSDLPEIDVNTVAPDKDNKNYRYQFTAKDPLAIKTQDSKDSKKQDPIDSDFTITYYTKPTGVQGSTTYNSATNSLAWHGTTITVNPPAKPGTPDDGHGTGTTGTKDTPTPGITKTSAKPDVETINDKPQLVQKWTVDLNAQKAKLDPDTVITDTMKSGLTKDGVALPGLHLLIDSTHSFDVSANDIPLSPQDYQVKPGLTGSGFTINLTSWLAKDPANNPSKHIHITYFTARDLHTDDNGLTNTASFNYTPDNGKTSVTVPPANLDQPAGGKTFVGFDKTTGVITWKVDVNGNFTTLGDNAVLMDPLPSGLALSNQDGTKTYQPGAADLFSSDNTKPITATAKGASADDSKGALDDLAVSYQSPLTDTLKKQFPNIDVNKGALVFDNLSKHPKAAYEFTFYTKVIDNGSNKDKLMNSVHNTVYFNDSTHEPNSWTAGGSFYGDSDMLSKSGYLANSKGLSVSSTDTAAGDMRHAKFSILVHPSMDNFTLKNPVVNDSFGDNLTFDKKEMNLKDPNFKTDDTFPDVFNVYYQSDTDRTHPFSEVPLPDPKTAGSDNTSDNTKLALPTYSVARTERGFTLNFYGNISQPVVIEYTTSVKILMADLQTHSFAPKNTVQMSGEYNSGKIDATTAKASIPATSGTASGVTGSVTLHKVAGDTGNALSGATFTLNELDTTQTDPNKKWVPIQTQTTDDSGTLTWDNLEYGHYQLKEDTAPKGYQAIDSKKDPQEFDLGINGKSEDFTTTIKDPALPRQQVTINKSWASGSDSHPKTAEFQLMKADGSTEDAAVGKPVTLTDPSWTYTWSNLPGGEEYSVQEVNKPDGYKDVSGPTETQKNQIIYNVTNVRQGTTSISGTKDWKDGDNQDGLRPSSVTVQLVVNGTPQKGKENEREVTAANNWKYSFTDLQQYDAQGNKITYTVQEKDVPAGYAATEKASEDGTKVDITNTHTPKTITVNGVKTWNDDNNRDGKRPDHITLHLLANGEPVKDKELTVNAKGQQPGNDWHYAFTDLPAYANGSAIHYSVKEDAVPGYQTASNDMDIVNTYTPRRTIIYGRKVWHDDANQDGERPATIMVYLLADGKQVGQQKVSGNATSTTWNFKFTGLPLNETVDGKTKKIDYTLKEDPVAGYAAKADGLTLTNTREPEKVTIQGTKTWQDNNNQDGLRPQTITLNLVANNYLIKTTQVRGLGNVWKYSFGSLAKYENGKPIHYQVFETPVPGYETQTDQKVDTENNLDFNFTNTHTPGKTVVTGRKIWNDSKNQDHMRPTQVKVQLFANGKPGAIRVVKGPFWSYSFAGLPLSADGKLIHYSVKEVEVPDGYTSTVSKDNVWDLVNTHQPEETKIAGRKTWVDNQNQTGMRPKSIEVLLRVGNAPYTHIQAKQIVTAKNNWHYSFDRLPVYNNGRKITYSIDELPVTNYKTEVKGNDLINRYMPETVQIKGQKTWADDQNKAGMRPKSIEVELLTGNKQVYEVQTVTAKDNWHYNFTHLPKYANGKEIKYAIAEKPVANYTTDVKGTDLVNHFTPAKVQLKGQKTWVDDHDETGMRPKSIEVELLTGHDQYKHVAATQTVTAKNNWHYSFVNLPQFANGKKIEYSIGEKPVANYTSSVTKGTNDLVNRYTPGRIQLKGQKTWVDDHDQAGMRPKSIEVELLTGKDPYKHIAATQTVTAKNNWHYSFVNLPQFANGKKIEYSIGEKPVANYTASVTKGTNDLVNHFTPDRIALKGQKTWVDDHDKAGMRPKSIEVDLLANGAKKTSQTVTAKNDWHYSFTNLPKYANGKTIVYTVDEKSVTDYTSTVKGTDLINRYTPNRVQLKGYKTWVDDQNKAGMRPDSIEVELLANGKVEKTQTVDAKNNWHYNFVNLTKSADGKAIKYTVAEKPVAHYTTEVKGTNLINRYTPGTTELKGQKTWDDQHNQDGLRPNSITVELLANGKVQTSQTVTAKNNWHYDFNHLAKYADGQAVKYTVREQSVAQYASEVKGSNIINHHQPGTTVVQGTKTWDDLDNQDGLRPNSITIDLLANGKQTAKQTVSAATQWQYAFKNLPVNADGKKIDYTVHEEAVTGYQSVIKPVKDNVFDVLNSRVPDQTHFSVTKLWKNDDQNLEQRPNAIHVQLMANDAAQGQPVVLDAANNWQYQWQALPLNHAGEKIKYAVQELDVLPNYQASQSTDAAGNVTLVNTFVPTTPTTPNTPNQPNLPNTPGNPSQPNTPGNPGQPNLPNTGVPGKPHTPDVPNPGLPNTHTPDVPNPGLPNTHTPDVPNPGLPNTHTPNLPNTNASTKPKTPRKGNHDLPDTGDVQSRLAVILGLLSLLAASGLWMTRKLKH